MMSAQNESSSQQSKFRQYSYKGSTHDNHQKKHINSKLTFINHKTIKIYNKKTEILSKMREEN